MSSQSIKEKLIAKFGAEGIELVDNVKTPYLRVPVERLREAVAYLRDDADLRFNSLLLISGVDYEDRIDVVYHLRSYSNPMTIALKVSTPRETALVPSITDIHPAANWHERETFDLIGVRFEGHPNLRRILLQEDWEGHPLRKDYVMPEEYHGISAN